MSGLMGWLLLAPVLIGVLCMVLHDVTGNPLFAVGGQIAAGFALMVVVLGAGAAWRARRGERSPD
ncbi:hypothetical protein E4T66_01310 [Sinimarinibacterium sp. CAU 1509]|uniref:hypothetical protein n=1 Tax=Sinimarinibacterium sp. CAU 1509 TaxID=2562283 RepID=UPI0010AB8320|nr:hypothetical protein [Sinimarinibacterium sp. CAU 1509]TJY64896.1 hypothetical protein E4T66_01310 [Sinimarinibacterium sp. CAU 1509]